MIEKNIDDRDQFLNFLFQEHYDLAIDTLYSVIIPKVEQTIEFKKVQDKNIFQPLEFEIDPKRHLIIDKNKFLILQSGKYDWQTLIPKGKFIKIKKRSYFAIGYDTKNEMKDIDKKFFYISNLVKWLVGDLFRKHKIESYFIQTPKEHFKVLKTSQVNICILDEHKYNAMKFVEKLKEKMPIEYLYKRIRDEAHLEDWEIKNLIEEKKKPSLQSSVDEKEGLITIALERDIDLTNFREESKIEIYLKNKLKDEGGLSDEDIQVFKENEIKFQNGDVNLPDYELSNQWLLFLICRDLFRDQIDGGLVNSIIKEERNLLSLDDSSRSNIERKTIAFYTLIAISKELNSINEDIPYFLKALDNAHIDSDILIALIRLSVDGDVLNEYFPIFFELLKKIQMGKFGPFKFLMKASIESGILKKIFSFFLNFINYFDRFNRHTIFIFLLNISLERDLLKDNFLYFLDAIEELTHSHDYSTKIENYELKWVGNTPNNLGDGYYEILAFSDLIFSIKDSELIDVHFTRLETHFLSILQFIVKNSFFNSFFRLFIAIRGSRLVEKHFTTIESNFLSIITYIENLDFNSGFKFDYFYYLIDAFKGTEFIEKHYSVLRKLSGVLISRIRGELPELFVEFENSIKMRLVEGNETFNEHLIHRYFIKTNDLNERNNLFMKIKVLQTAYFEFKQ